MKLPNIPQTWFVLGCFIGALLLAFSGHEDAAGVAIFLGVFYSL